jgi:hypothetical protein
LSDGEWHTGLELCDRIGARYATGLMSFVRKLRRPEFGGHIIDCEYSPRLSRLHDHQIYRYRMRDGMESYSGKTS